MQKNLTHLGSAQRSINAPIGEPTCPIWTPSCTPGRHHPVKNTVHGRYVDHVITGSAYRRQVVAAAGYASLGTAPDGLCGLAADRVAPTASLAASSPHRVLLAPLPLLLLGHVPPSNGSLAWRGVYAVIKLRDPVGFDLALLHTLQDVCQGIHLRVCLIEFQCGLAALWHNLIHLQCGFNDLLLIPNPLVLPAFTDYLGQLVPQRLGVQIGHAGSPTGQS